MKVFNLISTITILALSQPSLACYTRPAEITLKRSSLVKQKIEVAGNQVIFDGGTSDQLTISYNIQKKLWCMSGPSYENGSSTCLEPIGEADKLGRAVQFKLVSANGNSRTAELEFSKDKDTYANIRVVGNTLYVVDLHNPDKYLKFTDDTEGSSERLKITAQNCDHGLTKIGSCQGGIYTSSRNSLARNLDIPKPAPAKIEAVDLAASAEWASNGCANIPYKVDAEKSHSNSSNARSAAQ